MRPKFTAVNGEGVLLYGVPLFCVFDCVGALIGKRCTPIDALFSRGLVGWLVVLVGIR